MTKHAPALLSFLVLACGGGTGKSTSDASASSGDAEGTATTATATTTMLTGAATSTSGATGSSASSGSSGELSTGAGSSTGPGTTGASTSTGTTATSTGEATTGAGTTASDTSSSSSSSSSSGGEQCQGQGMSCAGVGALCCQGLDCCAGVPVPEGKEFCSNNCPISDRNLKTEFAEIDAAQVLARVVALPISTWRYRKDGAEVRHLGPMAQDFHAAFGLWNTDKMIFPLDASGVSFAAIQALDARLVAAEAENEALRARLDRIEQALDR